MLSCLAKCKDDSTTYQFKSHCNFIRRSIGTNKVHALDLYTQKYFNQAQNVFVLF